MYLKIFLYGRTYLHSYSISIPLPFLRLIVIDFVAIAGTETESGLSSRLMGDPYDDTESSITSVSQIGRRRPGQRLPQLSRVQQHLRYVAYYRDYYSVLVVDPNR
jgi:hypothetical protein